MRVRPGSSIGTCGIVIMRHDIHHIKIDLWHIGVGSDIEVLNMYDGDAKIFDGDGP